MVGWRVQGNTEEHRGILFSFGSTTRDTNLNSGLDRFVISDCNCHHFTLKVTRKSVISRIKSIKKRSVPTNLCWFFVSNAATPCEHSFGLGLAEPLAKKSICSGSESVEP